MTDNQSGVTLVGELEKLLKVYEKQFKDHIFYIEVEKIIKKHKSHYEKILRQINNRDL